MAQHLATLYEVQLRRALGVPSRHPWLACHQGVRHINPGSSWMQVVQRLAALYEEQLGEALATQAQELQAHAADTLAAERLHRISAIDEVPISPRVPNPRHSVRACHS